MEPRTIKDPLGNEVYIPDWCCDPDDRGAGRTGIYDSVADVVARPALILQIAGEKPEYYYYRSIGWSLTMLIGVRSVDGHYEAHQCVTNPSESEMGELYKRGKLVY